MTAPAPPTPMVSYRSWPPRLTNRILLDLRIWMMGFGLLIGIVFPFAVVALGVPQDVAIRPAFFAATILAGLLVGAINTALVQVVVGVRLRALAISMRRVEVSMREATETGDWSSCDPASCRVPVDSTDELGEAADSFNLLVESLAASHRVTEGISAIGEAPCRPPGARSSGRVDPPPVDGAYRNRRSRSVGSQWRPCRPRRLTRYPGRVGARGFRRRPERHPVTGSPGSSPASRGHSDRDGRQLHSCRGAGSSQVRYGVAIVGVLVLAAARPMDREAVAVVESVLPSLAVALTNALNHQDLQRVAALDPLTSAYNRRFGVERLKEVARSLRSGDSLGTPRTRSRPLQGSKRHLRPHRR